MPGPGLGAEDREVTGTGTFVVSQGDAQQPDTHGTDPELFRHVQRKTEYGASLMSWRGWEQKPEKLDDGKTQDDIPSGTVVRTKALGLGS